jgi:hypothetical protein
MTVKPHNRNSNRNSNHSPVAAIEAAFKWLLSNRSSQEIPPRLDFILDQFDSFIAKGKKDFR